MKFIDSSMHNSVAAERIKVAASVISIILICAIASIGVVSLMEAQSRAERNKKAQQLESILAATTSYSETTTEETTTTSDTDLAPVVGITNASDSSATSESSESSEASESDLETTETIEATETSESTSEETTETIAVTELTTTETTVATTVETTTEATTTTTYETTTEATTTLPETSVGITESVFYAEVYAASEINVRTGPGTDFGVVKTVEAGGRIDVVATTSNGWYRTYNGNYCLASLTTSTPPETVATTAATTTTEATTAATTTTEATTTTTAATTSGSAPSIDGMTYFGSCTITFFGPQLMDDGSYSTGTATGTQCSEGRTVAADWAMLPAGTIIYIANDPLGGDGYYTVEDRGSGVNGYHVDIYAEDGESGNHSTTSRDVYIVN